MAETVILDFTSPEGPRATHVRNTLINASIATLRHFGIYEQLVGRLSPMYHDQLLYNFAPSWLPIEVGCKYYECWEQLEISEETYQALGRHVSDRIQGSLLSTVLRSARAAGATPWIALRQFDRFWSRVFRGGTVRVIERGTKEAVINVRGVPFFDGRHFRTSFCHVLEAAGNVFARTIYVRELPRRHEASQTVLASWV